MKFSAIELSNIEGVPDFHVVRFNSKANRYALLIPVINESSRILGQLEEIKQSNPEIDVIIADGGSSDGSMEYEKLAELGVAVLLTKIGQGKLSAQLRMGMYFCLNEGYEGIVTMDGNGKDGVEGVKVLKTALDSGFDFIQGSRFKSGGEAINTPWLRYVAIRGLHAPITSLGAKRWFTDTTNGFRGLSRKFLSDPKIAPFRDVFDTYELIAYLPIRAARLKYQVTEVPVKREYPRTGRVPTKIHGTSGYIRLFKILIKSILGAYDPHPKKPE